MTKDRFRETNAGSDRVPFTPDQVVLLDGYPRRHYGAVEFRFVIVLPPDAVPLDHHLRQPLLTKEILSNFLRTSVKEFERNFGWKVSSYERFPKFDAITEFMNRALIPIGFILLVLMFILAYWSTTISRSTNSGEGWLVSGISGGKNTALKRTLEIIEEQKALENEWNREKQRRLRAQHVSSSSDTVLEIESSEKQNGSTLHKSTKASRLEAEMIKSSPTRLGNSVLNEVPPMYFRPTASSISSQDSVTVYKYPGARRTSHRLSATEDGNFNIKRHRKIRAIAAAKRHPQRHWKTSMALGGFGKS